MNDLPTCPACGQRHLAVATRCPHCGHAFYRDPYEETSYEPRNRLRPVLVGGALVAAIGVGLWAVSQQGPLGPTAANTAPAARPTRDAPAADAALAAPPIRDTPATDTAPAALPARDTATAIVTAAPVVAAPPHPEPDASPTTPGVTMSVRWASTWANVREAPDITAPVVLILDPGEQVEVGERDRGYLRVYVDGRPVGYVAGSLLMREPPT